MNKFWEWMQDKNYGEKFGYDENDCDIWHGFLAIDNPTNQMLLGYMLEYLEEVNPEGIHKIEYNDFEQLCEEIKKRVEEING
jgi:hypothetical protein